MARLDEHLVDKRIIERNMRKELLTRYELDKHLESLPDAEGNAEVVELGAAAEGTEEGES